MPLLEWPRAWLVGHPVSGKVMKSVLRCPSERSPSKLGRGEEAVKEGFLEKASPLPSASDAKRPQEMVFEFMGEQQFASLLSQ